METKLEKVILEFENRVWERICKDPFKKEFRVLFEKDVGRIIKELRRRHKIQLRVILERKRMILDNTEDEPLKKQRKFAIE